ncbi:hypothetical protein ACF0H5_009875 [Mactra antiquata]
MKVTLSIFLLVVIGCSETFAQFGLGGLGGLGALGNGWGGNFGGGLGGFGGLGGLNGGFGGLGGNLGGFGGNLGGFGGNLGGFGGNLGGFGGNLGGFGGNLGGFGGGLLGQGQGFDQFDNLFNNFPVTQATPIFTNAFSNFDGGFGGAGFDAQDSLLGQGALLGGGLMNDFPDQNRILSDNLISSDVQQSSEE